jgi:hypothetical protein
MGAAEYPRMPDLAPKAAFAVAARALGEYFLDQQGFNVGQDNLLSLFDAPEGPRRQMQRMARFLRSRTAKLEEAGRPVRDLILYYVGYGAYVRTPELSSDYYLALRTTQSGRERDTGLLVTELLRTLKPLLAVQRLYMIVDAGFGSALAAQFNDLYASALLLAADGAAHQILESADQEPTAFTGALLGVLRDANLLPQYQSKTHLSFADLHTLTARPFASRFPANQLRPYLHLRPENSELAAVGLFPNQTWRRRQKVEMTPFEVGRQAALESEDLAFLDPKTTPTVSNQRWKSLLPRSPTDPNTRSESDFSSPWFGRVKRDTLIRATPIETPFPWLFPKPLADEPELPKKMQSLVEPQRDDPEPQAEPQAEPSAELPAPNQPQEQLAGGSAPSPATTLVVLLGASEFPRHGSFTSNPAFAASAAALQAYFLDPQGFGLPSENLLPLFDVDAPLDEIDERIDTFLRERTHALTAGGSPARDVVLYYVGHGGFTGLRNEQYFLALRRTASGREQTTGFGADVLASRLNSNTRFMRRYVIIDACFSAEFVRSLQTSPATAIVRAINDALDDVDSGTVLLCAADKDHPAYAPSGEPYTVFSGALLAALRAGDSRRGPRLSPEQVWGLVQDEIKRRPVSQRRLPELHSPRQNKGDVRRVPLFPNPAWGGTPAQVASVIVPEGEQPVPPVADQGEAATQPPPKTKRPPKTGQASKKKAMPRAEQAEPAHSPPLRPAMPRYQENLELLGTFLARRVPAAVVPFEVLLFRWQENEAELMAGATEAGRSERTRLFQELNELAYRHCGRPLRGLTPAWLAEVQQQASPPQANEHQESAQDVVGLALPRPNPMPSITLAPSQMERPLQAIINAFSRAELQRALWQSMDMRLDEVAAAGPLTSEVFELLRWANQHDRVAELVYCLYAANPGNLRLAAVYHELLGGDTPPGGLEDVESPATGQ